MAHYREYEYGSRSERIRTYNYPQSRITDHRIGLTIHSLPQFMDGDIEEMIRALEDADYTQRIQELISGDKQ